MSDALGLMFGLAGFVALSLSLRRHQNEVLGRVLARPETLGLRAVGYGAITFALAIAMIAHGVVYGIVVWTGLISLAAAMTVAGLSARKDRARSAKSAKRAL